MDTASAWQELKEAQMGIFNIDGPLFQKMSRAADMMILNLLFILCCLPIVTIGAAITALCYVMLKMRDQEEGYITRSFFRSLKENFRQSTVIWLVLAVFAAILGMDFYLVNGMEGTFGTLMRLTVYLGTLIWLMVFVYVFPLQSRFYNTVFRTMKNALLLSLAQLPRTFGMIAVLVGAVLLTFWNGYTITYGFLVWLLCGFSFLAWVNSLLLHKPIKKLMPSEEEEG